MTETDWKAELEAFGKEVAEDAQEASAYTVERLEALPDSVRHVPDKLTHLPPVDPQHVQQSLQQVSHALVVSINAQEQLVKVARQEHAILSLQRVIARCLSCKTDCCQVMSMCHVGLVSRPPC